MSYLRSFYRLVKVEARPDTISREITCRSCGAPLPAREGRFVCKYFRKTGEGSVRRPVGTRDVEGYEMNFLKPAQKTIADHGGKYLAGGFNKTLSLSGSEPPNRVVLLQFANMDAVKAWRKEGEADLENDVGEKYATFRVYAMEGAQ